MTECSRKFHKYRFLIPLILIFVVSLLNFQLNWSSSIDLKWSNYFYGKSEPDRHLLIDKNVSDSLYLMMPALYSDDTYYYIQRSLCSSVFSSNILPKKIYISIDSMKRNKYEKKNLFENMIDEFNKYFAEKKVKLFVHFRYLNKTKKGRNWGGNKNYLVSKIKEDMKDIDDINSISPIIQVLDIDDIYHPYLLQYIHYIFNNYDRNNNMNSYLHRFLEKPCRWNGNHSNYLFNIPFQSYKQKTFNINSYISQCNDFNQLTKYLWFDTKSFYEFDGFDGFDGQNQSIQNATDYYNISKNIKLNIYERFGCSRSVGNGWITTTFKLLNITKGFEDSGRLEDCQYIANIKEYGGEIYVINPIISIYCRGIDNTHSSAAFVKKHD